MGLDLDRTWAGFPFPEIDRRRHKDCHSDSYKAFSSVDCLQNPHQKQNPILDHCETGNENHKKIGKEVFAFEEEASSPGCVPKTSPSFFHSCSAALHA